jgi:hypothetical protein
MPTETLCESENETDSDAESPGEDEIRKTMDIEHHAFYAYAEAG